MVSKTLSALMVVRNEEEVLRGCLDRIHDFVDEIIFIDMQSTDKTAEIAKAYPKVKYFEYEYSEPVRMDLARTMSFEKATGDWCWIIDADEWYEKEDAQKVRDFVINPGDAISARVGYHNLAWRPSYKQVFEHYPDRLYRRDVFDHYEGILPLDMVVVKPEFRLVDHKGKGMEGVLEYDNVDDRSFEHPRQPILDVWYYHLARIRGFNFEYSKRKNYERFTHPQKQDWEIEQNVRMNQWVTGLYPMEKIDVPEGIPTKLIPNPKVSIIIPCYNKAKWIGEAIESCLNQTHKPYEIIVIDDGSTDDSRAACERYIEGISYFRQDNAGVSTSRNNGLAKATGDYFILLDADDKLHPNYIERCLQEMKGDTQIVYTDCFMIGEWNWTHSSPEPDQIRTAQVIPSTMALCDMRILDPYGNFKDVKTFEDAEFWLNCYYNRKMNFKHISEPLCYYRRTQGTRIDYLNETAKERYEVLNNLYKDFNVKYL